jgi:hypothetical protein
VKALAVVAGVALLACPAICAAQRGPRPVDPGGPPPRAADGRADLSGVWNKNLVVNTSRGVEPLPFTPEGLKAFNDVWNHIDPTSRCIFPGVPRVNTSPYPFQIVNRHSDALHVIERWTRTGANALHYEETIDDPKFYTKPWTVGWDIPLAPKTWVVMEYACTDNNKDMYDGHLQNGPLDGSARDGSAIGKPAPPRR